MVGKFPVGLLTGDPTGLDTGVLSGVATGLDTGVLSGVVTGKVTGELSGDLSGELSGELTGFDCGTDSGRLKGACGDKTGLPAVGNTPGEKLGFAKGANDGFDPVGSFVGSPLDRGDNDGPPSRGENEGFANGVVTIGAIEGLERGDRGARDRSAPSSSRSSSRGARGALGKPFGESVPRGGRSKSKNNCSSVG